jgi:diguanylate cyclase (GGDEF)-like protein
MSQLPGTVVVAVASLTWRERVADALRERADVRFVATSESFAQDADVAIPDDCSPDELTRILGLLARLAAARAESNVAQAGAKRWAQLAETDPLTQLANRRAWDDALAAWFAESAGRERQLCLALVDLDEFKRVNDEHGHTIGDAVLKTFAEGLRSTIRQDDLAARIGGDEFALLLPQLTPDRAATVLDRIRRATVDKLALAKLPAVTCSIGYANRTSAHTTGVALTAAADEVLRRAKRVGRNRMEAAAIDEPSKT